MSSELSFRGQGLTSIPQEVIEEHGKTCTTLDLTENQIHDFKWLEKFPNLTTLILDHNGISSLASMPRCPSIETLWLNNNNLKDLKGLADCVVKNFPNVNYLSALKNPCTPDMYFAEDEGEAYQRYRYYVLYRIKRLEMLDATPIDEEERKKADTVGYLMAPAKPVDDGNTSVEAYSVKSVLSNATETKTSTFLVKSKPRYDGTNSEGNRFITNDDL